VAVGQSLAERVRLPIRVAVEVDVREPLVSASSQAAGGGMGDSLVLSLTATSTWAEW